MTKSYLRRNRIVGQFAWRLIEMLDSPAYRALSHAAHRLLARLEIELAHHGGRQNGKLPVTYEQMAEYGIRRKTIPAAIRETVALGFIEVTERGHAGNAEFRTPSKYRLTYRHVDRANPTDEWRRIKTDEEAAAIIKRARQTACKSSRRKPRKNGKQKPRRHFAPVSGGTSPPETGNSPGGISPPTVLGGTSPPTIDISGGGGDVAESLSEGKAKPRPSPDGDEPMAMAAMSETGSDEPAVVPPPGVMGNGAAAPGFRTLGLLPRPGGGARPGWHRRRDRLATPRLRAAVSGPARRRVTADAERFLTQWGQQAAALGWTERDLFGLHEPPAKPHPSYRRFSRRDCIGLVWLLQGAPVVALTADAAAIETPDRTSRLKYYRPAATSAVPASIWSDGLRSTTSSSSSSTGPGGNEGNALSRLTWPCHRPARCRTPCSDRARRRSLDFIVATDGGVPCRSTSISPTS